MSVADYAEIVKALRLCSAVNSSCEECPCNDPADDLCECANKVSIAAADAIENLLIENAALRRQIDNLTSAQAVMVKEFEGKMEELHDSKSEKEAIEILIAVAVCDRPILSCDFCSRYAGAKTECKYPTDKEIEQAVLLLKGVSK